jgi:rhodanese-related sulfurtransferase
MEGKMYGIVSKYKLGQWITEKENLFLIDVLSEKDFAKSHIPGSVNIPFEDNKAFVAEVEKHGLSKDSRIVVYCTGVDYAFSKQAARQLEDAGFINIYEIESGVASLVCQNNAAWLHMGR